MSMLVTGYHCKSYLSVQWAFAWGMAHSSASCCLHNAEQEQLGWSSSWADSRDPAQPPAPVQHWIHSEGAFPTSALNIPYSGPVTSSFSSTFSGGLLCVDFPYQETIKFTCFMLFWTLCKDYTELQNILGWVGSTRITESPPSWVNVLNRDQWPWRP